MHWESWIEDAHRVGGGGGRVGSCICGQKKQHSEDPVGGLHSHDSANDGLLQISGRPAVFLIGCFFSLLITYDHVDLTRVHDNSSANISGKNKKKRKGGTDTQGRGKAGGRAEAEFGKRARREGKGESWSLTVAQERQAP